MTPRGHTHTHLHTRAHTAPYVCLCLAAWASTRVLRFPLCSQGGQPLGERVVLNQCCPQNQGDQQTVNTKPCGSGKGTPRLESPVAEGAGEGKEGEAPRIREAGKGA